MSGLEQGCVQAACASNWIAPLGPQVDAFEADPSTRRPKNQGNQAHLRPVPPAPSAGPASSPSTARRSSPPPAAGCVAGDKGLIDHARKLSTQARDDAPHYQHSEIGYNYRLSNLLAAVGRGQLQVLPDRVAAKRRIFNYYAQTIGDLPGITLMPEAPWGRCTRWLTCITVDPQAFGANREAIRVALEKADIESHPLWKPMHLQPVFQDCEIVGGRVAEALFRDGLCLPSGTAMSDADLERVVGVVRGIGTR